MLRKIINADDFGISPGVNKAVITAFQNGVLNSASLMANVAYTDEAAALALANPGLSVGVHLNLTNQKNQKPLAGPKEIPLLVDENGLLKHGFAGLLLLSVLKKKEFQKQAETEMRRQIEFVLKKGIKISHLDSHRHVHMIPALFACTEKLRREYGIARLRAVNESFAHTFFTIRRPQCFFDGGIIKYALLKFFYYVNRVPSETYFYSILYTTRLFGKNVRRIRVPEKYAAVEIGIHPSCTAEDAAVGSDAFNDYLLYSSDRQKEFETLMDGDFPARIS